MSILVSFLSNAHVEVTWSGGSPPPFPTPHLPPPLCSGHTGSSRPSAYAQMVLFACNALLPPLSWEISAYALSPDWCSLRVAVLDSHSAQCHLYLFTIYLVPPSSTFLFALLHIKIIIASLFLPALFLEGKNSVLFLLELESLPSGGRM